MLSERRLMTFAAVVSVVAVATGGIALAASRVGHKASTTAATSVEVRGAIAAFRAAPRTAPGDIEAEASLKREFGGINSAIGSADFSDAQPAPITGSSASAWIAPSNGDVCSFLPDPVNGWGGGCYSLSAVEAGNAYVLLGGGPGGGLAGKVVVAVVVPDGGTAPTVVSSDGTRTALSVTGNVAAAVVPSTDKLETGNNTIGLSAVQPAKVRWVG